MLEINNNSEKQNNIVGSKPLMPANGTGSSIAFAFRAISPEPNSTSTLDLVPTLAALNESTHYECEVGSQRGEKIREDIEDLLFSCFPTFLGNGTYIQL